MASMTLAEHRPAQSSRFHWDSVLGCDCLLLGLGLGVEG